MGQKLRINPICRTVSTKQALNTSMLIFPFWRGKITAPRQKVLKIIEGFALSYLTKTTIAKSIKQYSSETLMSGSRNFPSPMWQHDTQRIQCLLTTDCTASYGYSNNPLIADNGTIRHCRRKF